MAIHGSFNRFAHHENMQKWSLRIISGITALNGIVAILEVLYSRFPTRLERLELVDFDLYGRYFGLFAGFVLIYIASQLSLGKRVAWWMAYGASLVATLASAFYYHNLAFAALPALCLILLAISYEQFSVRGEWVSIAQGLRLFALCAVITLVFGSIGFTRLSPRDFVEPHHVSLAHGAWYTIREYSLVGNPDFHLHTRRGWILVDAIHLMGGISTAFAFYSLFRPLLYRYNTLPGERLQAQRIIEAYGNSSEDAFKLWPEDKAYFFNANSTCVIAYQVKHGCALVLGMPVGMPADIASIIQEFKRFCRQHDWAITFIYVTAESLSLFEAMGLRPLKIGEDAIVDTATFTTETIRSKHFRGIMNKFNRLGYTFEILASPQQAGVLTEAAAVTKAWLGEDGRQERGFALGYHDRHYLQQNRLYVVRTSSGELVAFANGIRSYDTHEATIDLMRYRPGNESGLMDFMLARIIMAVHNEGVGRFSLGLAPLAGVGQSPHNSIEERLIGLAGRLGVGNFSFEGLRRFKNKFDPTWQPQYLVYERGAVGLTRTVLTVTDLIGG